MNHILAVTTVSGLALFPSLPMAAPSVEAHDRTLDVIEVTAKRRTSKLPAIMFQSMASSWRHDSEVDLQARGLPEGQADLTTRGGIFESVGAKVGAITIHDPQTGHYTFNLPLDPSLFDASILRTGIDNAIVGVNATIASIEYQWQPISEGGGISLGVGSDQLRSISAEMSAVTAGANDSQSGVELLYSGSSGDGSQRDGDHRFERTVLHGQRQSDSQQSDVAIAYQQVFFGWPGAYTGFPQLAETDHTKTTLLIANHRWDLAAGDASRQQYVEIGGYYRELEDNYDFDRTTAESGMPGSFEHQTRSYAVGARGLKVVGVWGWQYSLQLTGDELVRSTDLSFGRFRNRALVSGSLVPERRWILTNNRVLRWRAGLRIDASNRHANALSPQIGLSLERQLQSGVERYEIEFGSNNQVPGYTALASNPVGLFGGNADLDRERAHTLSVQWQRQLATSSVELRSYYRRDRSLVDWTYLGGAPFVRQANAVDLDVLGSEIRVTRDWAKLSATASYTYLDKSADYGSAAVDASYYALNFARHRATIGLLYRATPQLLIRMDNEYRHQASNPLRNGNSETYVGSLNVDWAPIENKRLLVSFVVDNLSDSDFEEFPGTPPARRRAGIRFGYSWR